MAKTSVTNALEVPKCFTDVLYLSNQKQIPSVIKRLLKQKKLTFSLLAIDKLQLILNRLDLIGTVIVDAQNLDILQQQKLARIIESLEVENIGVILLNGQVESPVKSFSLAPVKSFSLAGAVESVSMDELWTRISVNLAYRKKSNDIVVKPAGPPKETGRTYGNQLAEQLRMTGTLIENLTEQLRLAGLVQRDFLPAQLPNTEKIKWATIFLPAEWVSGDIYDIVSIDQKHIGFYVADAVGHSMPAALLTIFLKQAMVMSQTVRAKLRVFSPVEVIGTLNRKMAAQKLSGYQFATCCYCLLDIETLQLTYARAGHPYPILIRPGHEPQRLEIRGSLLGIFEQAEYTQQTVQLQPGDKLLLYSDGAEPFIGVCNDQADFNFSQEFYALKDLPIVEMFDKFRKLIKSKKISPSEFDDITAVGLEII